MTTPEIRAAYLKFFADRGHALIPRALLVPQNDATTLFTGSGMQPLLPYLLGEDHPSGKRLVDSQTAFRAEDIDEVGDNRHTTFFEMLGNWSLGEYFKAEQLPWFFEFLTDVVGLDPKKLYVTAFMGDPKNNIPRDEEASAIWVELFGSKGIKAIAGVIGAEEHGYRRGMKTGERIFYYDAKKNWWSRAGIPENMPAGEPGGPDSEVFYRFDDSEHTEDEKKAWGEHCHPNCDCGRFMEIGNSVFMQYIKREDGGFSKLKQFNVDFGGGLERISAAANDDGDVFKISLLWPIIEQLEELSGYEYNQNSAAMRIIADHLRAATFLAVDGVVPSNTQQGYVLRRLVRRAIRQAHSLDLKDDFLEKIIPVITNLYRNDFPEVAEREAVVIETLVAEEKRFRRTLERGMRVFGTMVSETATPDPDGQKSRELYSKVNGRFVFMMSDTYGFPAELSIEEAKDRGIPIDENWRTDFDKLMHEQRERSRTAGAGQFKGGLVDHSQASTKYHTATHLMYQALRDVLGPHVVQRGSNITPERLRFDFSHDTKVTPEELAEVERIVNEQIIADLVITWEEYPTKVAVEEKGALGQFGDRYGETVKVYRMQATGADKPFSFEICGGPHVEHTGVLAEDGKTFKIKKEESSSSGVRRIKAVLE